MVPLTSRKLSRWLVILLFVTCTAGLVTEIAYLYIGIPAELAAFFSLSAEGNLPTWVASSLLLSCSLVLGSIAIDPACRVHRFRVHWWILAWIFLYMSLDEAVEIHEHLGGLVTAGGVLYFSWVIPAAAIVLALGLAYLPFLAHLDPIVRRRFVVAGSLYVGGALLMELPLGWWTEQHGDDNFGYAFMDWIEETLELVGASYFLVSLWNYRSEPSPQARRES
jgi:hypothetical protein